MSITFPNETPDYRAARDALIADEIALRAMVADVAAKRRTLPRGGALPTDYAFTDLDGSPAPLSGLFGPHSTLAIYSLMYGPDAKAPCPMCTSMLDGLAGQATHIAQKTSLIVVAQQTPQTLKALQHARGWSDLTILSAAGTTYQRDYNAETPDGAQLPMMNVFQKSADGIHHFWASEGFFAKVDGHPRHVDLMWPLWNVLDLTPEGRGDFMPALSYA